ncbi:DNA cytosine methyltransferase [Nitrosospira sp. Nsp13]|uniref:DNA cytosine methyltransferase n=1 Tax=Nitrosospira sp. Nsp13 TaxID=1855332 RepID=UPI000880E3DF|nr:DNA cytosine methyltransferase [Nitrosospira sp. Nsp13]SCX93421.1 DNA (cytosine-5)-methyltransferase 1 [Nitrosospira sp. Nsp13]
MRQIEKFVNENKNECIETYEDWQADIEASHCNVTKEDSFGPADRTRQRVMIRHTLETKTITNTTTRAMAKTPIPVIDLFAGPGGLGEGFSSLIDDNGDSRFAVRVSIEKDAVAHRTLSLRALFRSFKKNEVPDCYYDYVRGDISWEQLFSHLDVPEEARAAAAEAKNAELGKTPHEEIDGWIADALDGTTEWALIGGPPCQAYSLAGRSRRTKETTAEFEKDVKHFLYKEYLRILRRFGPSAFVMENVKGILSSQHQGSSIFERILADLASPGNGLSYRIRSLVVPGEGDELHPQDFVIKTEHFGVPQNRHRVILFGIRSDLAEAVPELAKSSRRFNIRPSPNSVNVDIALSGLPPLRSKLSKEPDSREAWLYAVQTATNGLWDWDSPLRGKIVEAMSAAAKTAEARESVGAPFIEHPTWENHLPQKLREWFLDKNLNGVIQHEARSHMRSDIHRYLFASCYADTFKYSPKLADFPPILLPHHVNVDANDVPFVDRFRVQLAGIPSSTVVSHIAKDGHYYIHPDPSQCRSLTVREAARLQTFPDNYFFEGSRTEQYAQIGNAVPPWLSKKIATIVFDFIEASRRKAPQ